MPLATLEDGLPVGVSIIGPRGSDEALLALAERLAAAVLGPPPQAMNGVHFTPPVCAEMLPEGLNDPQVGCLLLPASSPQWHGPGMLPCIVPAAGT